MLKEKPMNGKLVIIGSDGNVIGTVEEMMDKLFSQKPPLDTVPKPALGAKPYFIILPERIVELCGAITRYAESEKAHSEISRKNMRAWAQEIICYCDTMDKLEELEVKK